MNVVEPILKQGLTVSITDAGDLRIRGLSLLEPAEAKRIVEYVRQHKSAIVTALSPQTDNEQRLAPMYTCFHGRTCQFLGAPGGKSRPVCMKVVQYLFNLRQCPEGHWFYAECMQ